jgi:hypothetical protein
MMALILSRTLSSLGHSGGNLVLMPRITRAKRLKNLVCAT